ncbi:Uu.00g096860.m01.CDS01 [Anthostomella pinea]|uniref:Uu.00g096860.m01.CDS01 n=1 Tax=Anthostomella pinea TaxID=933095 RepID=A0AAI8YF01_9PEZI|nr:Uu.00g096860.m01.CDS01 [Anthostomella pinea]
MDGPNTKLNTGPLGWAYIALTVVWTVVVASGMWFLHRHRQLPFLQMRRLPLVFSAIVLLHIYGVATMVVYVIEPLVPCDAQFWIMSVYLPCGMALLQAANSHFLQIASQQRKYVRHSDLEDKLLSEKPPLLDPSLPRWKRTIQRVQSADQTTRTLYYISLGIVVQLIMTLFVYFGAEMFHPRYGFFHENVPAEQQRKKQCFTGWEWWLSIVWQFFWAYFYAPYMLWKTRHVRDTHGWRIQTIGCCVAGLPASPLWLAGLYSPQMQSVRTVVIPPQWITFSIVFIEIFTILFPCWHVVKTHNLQQETLDAIAVWEEKNKSFKGDDQTFATAAYVGTTLRSSIYANSRNTKATANSQDSRKSDTLTMYALESALQTNPQPLLEFAALKDFSGENISFLSHVADWKRAWTTMSATPDRERQQFIRAMLIYSNFISMDFSEFPVNISSRAAKDLQDLFGIAARRLNRPWSIDTGSSSATPFDGPSDNESTLELNTGMDLEDTLGMANLSSVTKMSNLSDEGHFDMPIPEGFNSQVFDVAEREVKYLVLTNTWPRFVHAGFENASRASARDGTGIFDGARKYFCGLERLV